jgi:hypothetical protein
MAHECITERVVNCLSEGILDVQEGNKGELISHENVVLRYSTGLDINGNHEIHCRLRVMTACHRAP